MINQAALKATQINGRIDAEQLLESLNIPPAQIIRDNSKIKTFCPIHKDTIVRSLVIDLNTNTFKCTYFQCRGTRGGDLLDLYAQATNIHLDEAIQFWGIKTGYLKNDSFSSTTLESNDDSDENDLDDDEEMDDSDSMTDSLDSSDIENDESMEEESSPLSIVSSNQESNFNNNISKEDIVMKDKVQDISTKDSPEERISKLSELEPDWFRQYRMQEAIHLSEIARREAVINAQIELLTDYWMKHRQNLKAYEQSTISLEEFHNLESKLMDNKRQRMNRSFVIGERAFRETYDKFMNDIIPSEELNEVKKESLVSA